MISSSSSQATNATKDGRKSSPPTPSATAECIISLLMCIVPTLLTRRYLLTSSSFPAANDDGNDAAPPHFLLQWTASIVLDTCYGYFFHCLLIRPARWIARRLPGAVVPGDDAACLRQEAQENDATLVWPLSGAALPEGWEDEEGKDEGGVDSCGDNVGDALAAPAPSDREGSKKAKKKNPKQRLMVR